MTPSQFLFGTWVNTLKSLRVPSFSQWQRLPRLLSKKERLSFVVFIVVFLGSLGFLLQGIYERGTREVPALGGTITEGAVGNPRFLNPVFAETNDIDRSLTQLIFSGLLRYNNEGALVEDLAASYRALDEGRVYEVTLRDNVRWHDGHPFTADDVVFTVQTLQDPRYKSPIRANWVGVQVQKINSLKVRFLLQEPFASFPDRLTQGIIPQHLWADVSPENFALSFYNLKPVGSGPYRLSDLRQDGSGAVNELTLKANTHYHLEGPFIKTITFKFFQTQEQMLSAANLGKLSGFLLSSEANPQRFRAGALRVHEFSLPRVFGVFFNLERDNSPITELDVRKALQLAVDKTALVQEVFEGNAVPVDSPVRAELFGAAQPGNGAGSNLEEARSLLQKAGYRFIDGAVVEVQGSSGEFPQDLSRGNQGPAVIELQECLAQNPQVYPEGIVNGVFGPATQRAVTAFQEKYAAEVLQPSGLSRGTGTAGPSTRAKLRELCAEPEETTPLRLTLTTLKQDSLLETARFIQKSFEELGVTVEIRALGNGELERDVIKPRNYEMLLFGEVLGRTPDPLPFWHSSQVKDPGLNLSLYENDTADTYLEQIRTEHDSARRAALLEQLQNLLLKDVPAVFLYDVPLRYVVSENVQGIQGQLLGDPSQRFAGILDWYITTKRVWAR